MLSLRSPKRNPLVRVVARLLILALVTTLAPLQADASIPATGPERHYPPSVNSSPTPAQTPSPTPSPASRSIPTRAGSTTELAGWIQGRGGSPGWIRGRVIPKGRPLFTSTLYADAGPASNVDPSGLQELGMTMVTLTINVSLNALSTFNPAAPVTSVATALLTGTAESSFPSASQRAFCRQHGGTRGPWVAFSVRRGGAGGLQEPNRDIQAPTGSEARTRGCPPSASHSGGSAPTEHFGWTTAQILQAPAQILTQAEHTVINTQLAKRLPTGVVYTKRHSLGCVPRSLRSVPRVPCCIAHLF